MACAEAFHGIELIGKFLGVAADAHANAAAARGAFEHHRIADARRLVPGMLAGNQQAAAAEHRQPGGLCQRTRGVLEPEGTQLLRRGAQKGDARRPAGFGETGVLRQESVAGVNCLGTAGFGRLKNSGDIQIRACPGAVAQADRP